MIEMDTSEEFRMAEEKIDRKLFELHSEDGFTDESAEFGWHSQELDEAVMSILTAEDEGYSSTTRRTASSEANEDVAVLVESLFDELPRPSAVGPGGHVHLAQHSGGIPRSGRASTASFTDKVPIVPLIDQDRMKSDYRSMIEGPVVCKVVNMMYDPVSEMKIANFVPVRPVDLLSTFNETRSMKKKRNTKTELSQLPVAGSLVCVLVSHETGVVGSEAAVVQSDQHLQLLQLGCCVARSHVVHMTALPNAANVYKPGFVPITAPVTAEMQPLLTMGGIYRVTFEENVDEFLQANVVGLQVVQC